MIAPFPLAARTVRTKGWILLALGTIHQVVAFTLESRKAEVIPPPFRTEYLVWFLALGIFILFLGLVDLLCAEEIGRKSPLAWKIACADAAFSLLTGLLGVSIFGFSPPLVLLAAGVAGLATLLHSRSCRPLREAIH